MGSALQDERLSRPVDGQGGFLCDPARPAEFTEALVRLLRGPAARAKQAAANAERVERGFRWERCVAATRREYDSVVAGWRQRAGTGAR